MQCDETSSGTVFSSLVVFMELRWWSPLQWQIHLIWRLIGKELCLINRTPKYNTATTHVILATNTACYDACSTWPSVAQK